ncbi:MAG: O-antigen ligase family protein, partial [Balneolaceae bacterium]
MAKFGFILICVAVAIITFVVDPFAHHSFTAPKHQLLIIIAPLLLLFPIWRRKAWVFGLIPGLFFIRILWLGVINPEWITHPGNDSFFLYLSLLLVLLAVTQFNFRNYTRFYFLTLFLIGILETAVGIWQLTIYTPDPTAPMKTAMVGTLGTSNGVGLLLVISLIAGMVLLKEVSTKWQQIGIAAGLLFILSGVGLSESRGALLALFTAGIITGSIFFYVSNKHILVKLKKYVAWIFTGLVFLSVALVYGLYSIDQESSRGRLMVWNISGEMMQEQPFTGIGQGNYAVEYLDYQADFLADSARSHLHYKAANLKQAHNEFFQAFVEGGIPGGVLFFLIWLLPLLYGMKRCIQSKQINWNLVAVLAIHISIITHCLVDSPLHVLPIAVIGYINLSMIPMPKKEFRLLLTSKIFMIVVLLIYTGFATYRASKLYPAYHEWKKGSELADREEWNPAVFHYQQALSKFGKKGGLEFNLGAAMVFNGQYSRGIYYLNQAKKDFNDRNIYLAESYANIQLQNYKAAERLAKQALKMFPDWLFRSYSATHFGGYSATF